MLDFSACFSGATLDVSPEESDHVPPLTEERRFGFSPPPPRVAPPSSSVKRRVSTALRSSL